MTIRVHFDGKVLVPDQPVDLPMNCALEAQVKPVEPMDRPLAGLVDLARKFPVVEASSDGASQHDHYLYGAPKKR